LLTTACWFIEASTILVREIALQLGVQIFGSVASSRSQLALCYAKSAPVALRCGDFAGHFPQNCRSVWNQAEFGFRNLPACRRTRRRPVRSCLEGASFKQNLPDA
jgi:hypothetical protein